MPDYFYRSYWGTDRIHTESLDFCGCCGSVTVGETFDHDSDDEGGVNFSGIYLYLEDVPKELSYPNEIRHTIKTPAGDVNIGLVHEMTHEHATHEDRDSYPEDRDTYDSEEW